MVSLEEKNSKLIKLSIIKFIKFFERTRIPKIDLSLSQVDELKGILGRQNSPLQQFQYYTLLINENNNWHVENQVNLLNDGTKIGEW